MELTIDMEEIETQDYVLGFDDFGGQRILKGVRAKINMVVNLIFMRKNSIQKAPNCGWDIMSRKHMLSKKSKISAMEEELKQQCKKYLPFTIYEINIIRENKEGDVKIKVLLEGMGYFEISTNVNEFQEIKLKIPDKEF